MSNDGGLTRKEESRRALLPISPSSKPVEMVFASKTQAKQTFYKQPPRFVVRVHYTLLSLKTKL